MNRGGVLWALDGLAVIPSVRVTVRVVRVSSGWDTTAEDWQSLAEAFVEAGQGLDAGGKPPSVS